MIAALERSAQRLYQWPSLLLGLAALFWAGNTVAARLAIGEISPLTLTTLRWLVRGGGAVAPLQRRDLPALAADQAPAGAHRPAGAARQ